MGHRVRPQTITGSSPDTATTAAVGNELGGLEQFDWFTIYANLAGSTNGAVDCVLQAKIDGIDEWYDWCRFPQVASGATAVYTCQSGSGASITATGQCTTASPSITLAANTFIGGHPGQRLRLVVTAGAGTDSAATQTIRVIGHRVRHA